MLWIPYLYLILELPDYNLDKELYSYRQDELFDKLSSYPLQSHPAHAYFKILLENMKLYRFKRLAAFTHDYERKKLIEECSWLCFKEQRMDSSNAILYYLNFKTGEKTYMMPESLMQAYDLHQRSLKPDNPSFFASLENTTTASVILDGSLERRSIDVKPMMMKRIKARPKILDELKFNSALDSLKFRTTNTKTNSPRTARDTEANNLLSAFGSLGDLR